MTGAPTFATSGANIWSEVGELSRLFWPGIDAIEIGSFEAPEDLATFLAEIALRSLRWAMHAPLWRTGLRRDLFGPMGLGEESMRQLDADFSVASELHADYIVLHFPSFADRSLGGADAHRQVERSMADVRALATRHGAKPVLELKLGLQRDPGVIGYLAAGHLDLLAAGEFGICLDVGDWLMATRALGLDPLRAFEPLAPVTRVVHVHGIHLEEEVYYWRPLHPTDPDAPAVAALCRAALRASREVRIVFEHRPHELGQAYDLEGLLWLKAALAE